MNLRLGCGSWTDDDYEGVLYPPDLPGAKRLAHYATVFNHLEINSTYYAMHPAATLAKWEEQTPLDFTFSLKLPRVFSDSPKKSAEGDQVSRVLERAEPLIAAKKLSCFFIVLPPRFGPAKSKLEDLDALIEKLRPHVLAIELRHNGWVQSEHLVSTLEFFRSRKIAWIAVDMPQVKDSTIMPAVDEVTLPTLAYLRLHGRNTQWLEAESAADRHAYSYTEADLKEIAKRAGQLSAKAKQVHVIANNHAKDFAPKTALRLKELLT